MNHDPPGFSEAKLAVMYGTDSAGFKFDSFNGTLNFASDHHGGTLATDPSAVSVRQEANASGSTSSDQFVFKTNLGNADHGTIDDFKPGPDSLSPWFSSHPTVSKDDLLIELNPEGHHPGQDAILLKNVMLADLHSNDFIFSR